MPFPAVGADAMSPNFTDDDEGKHVVNADGDTIGVVTKVHGGHLHVEPDPGVTDSIKSKLGWGDADEDTYQMDDSNVAEVTDDKIHLERM